MKPEELRLQAGLEDKHFWYAGRRRQVRRRLPRATSPDARALDLGAGSGGNTRLLTDAGYRAVALEHHPVAAEFSRSRGLEVVRGDGHCLPFSDGSFDVVLACDVLEHLRDDREAVRELHRVLRPGGVLVATVPADPSLWSPHDVALSHHRRYTRSALRAVLEEGGLTPLSLDAWMVLLRPLVRLRRKLAIRSAMRVGDTPDEYVSDLEPVAPPLNALLSLVLHLEDRLPALRGRSGVSLVAVAHRR